MRDERTPIRLRDEARIDRAVSKAQAPDGDAQTVSDVVARIVVEVRLGVLEERREIGISKMAERTRWDVHMTGAYTRTACAR